MPSALASPSNPNPRALSTTLARHSEGEYTSVRSHRADTISPCLAQSARSYATAAKNQVGKVKQVIGAVVDVRVVFRSLARAPCCRALESAPHV